MQTGASETAAARAMFSNLVDYAGLFPPAQLAMQQAVAEYAAEREGTHAWMLGRFIIQESRIAQLLAALREGERFGLSVILDRGAAALEDVARVRRMQPAIEIQALEIVLAAEQIGSYAAAAKSAALADVPTYVEFARGSDWEYAVPETMEELADSGLGAKIRCGGLEAKAFPTPAEVAVFIYWACRYNVPFKATAGLHHPVRHVDKATGFHMHGFLNLLAAAALARSDVGLSKLIEPIASEDSRRFHIDGRGLRFADYHVTVPQLESMRKEAFIAYGSCSFSEPANDLRALHLLS